MDVNNSGTNKSPSTYRFRVNRINSVVAGCHKDPINTIPEEGGGVGHTAVWVSPCPLETIPGSPSPSTDNNFPLESRPGPGKTLLSQVTSNNLGRRKSQNTMANNNSGPPPVVRKFSLANILGRRKSSSLPELDDFAQTNSTVGLYGKSLNQYTHDALPKMENYRNMMSFQAAQRPTIDELHEAKFRSPQKVTSDLFSGESKCRL